MRRARSAAVAALVLLCWGWGLPAPAHAQQYRFRVPSVNVVLTVEPDASVVIHYRMEFTNEPRARPIDAVDVGMPTEDYEVLAASLDGRPLNSWGPSPYIDIGPEVRLGVNAIQPGARATFECRARVADMVFEDSTDESRASLQFTPTWFGEEYVVGGTDLILMVRFPPGVQPDDVVWHSDERPFAEKGVLEPGNVAFVAWKERYRFTGPMLFGCSFPRAVMDRVVEVTPWGALLRRWQQSRRAQLVSGALFLLLFTVCFLSATRGTGITLLLVLLAASVFVMWGSPPLHLCLWPLLAALVVLWRLVGHFQKRRYLPALARGEGGRICRGLSAVESAVLLQRPLHQVLTMVITDLLRKGVVRVTNADPLEVEGVGTELEPNLVELPGGRQAWLEPYEAWFLAVLRRPPAAVARKDFGEELERLVGLVACKVTGFDVEATRDYYRAVSERAWHRLGHEHDQARKDALAESTVGWLTVAEDCDERMEEQRALGWHFRPPWYGWSRHDRGGEWLADRLRPAAAQSSRRFSSLADGLDLSGVDHATLEVLKGMAEGSRGGGGGGCACAGCACACACAGGGR